MTKRARLPSTSVGDLEVAFPHASNRNLAERFGISIKSVEMFGYRRGLKKSETLRADQRRSASAQQRDAYILGHNATQSAAEIAAVLGCPVRGVWDRAARLGVKCARGVYGPPIAQEAGLVTPTQPVSRQFGWSGAAVPGEVYARLTAAERRELPAVIPEGVKITRGPGLLYDPRYQVAPGEQVFGCGFSAVGIGRSVETGRAWGDGA